MSESNHRPFTAELRLRAARQAGATPIELAKVQALIESLIDEVRSLGIHLRASGPAAEPQPGTAPEEDRRQEQTEASFLRTEMRALAFCIEQTKAEIAALRPDQAESDHLATVTSELDAIVTATEAATQRILDGCEKIDTIARQMRAHTLDSFAGRLLEDLIDISTSILEACNFQDITGQRIGKVVRALQYVDQRINSMVDIWGRESIAGMLPKTIEADDAPDAGLLNGPQLGDSGITQDEIDRLFA